MRTNSKKNDVLLEHFKVLCISYSTGRFEPLFPLLSEECVFESQWVLTPHISITTWVHFTVLTQADLSFL